MFFIKFEILKCFNIYINYYLLMEFDFKSENMVIVWMKVVFVFCLVFFLFKLLFVFLELNLFLKILKECYDFCFYNMILFDEVVLMI